MSVTRGRVILATWLAAASACAAAQNAPVGAPAVDRVGEALAERAVATGGADAAFVRGLQATMDPAARTDAWARAWTLDPSRMLFLASLAEACATRSTPPLPACASHDPVSRWAARDGDNAAPWVLLAARARGRGDLPSMRANLAHAAERTRFDGYHGHGAAAVARVIGAVPDLARLPEAPFAAAALAAARPEEILDEAMALCRPDAPGVGPEVAPSCRRLAGTMAERADSMAGRQAGFALASGWAGDAAERARLAAGRDRLSASALECHAARSALVTALDGTPPARERARDVETAAAADATTLDEIAVCARRVARTRAAGLL